MLANINRSSVDWHSFYSEVTDYWLNNESSISSPEIFVDCGSGRDIDCAAQVRERPGYLSILALWGIKRETKRRFIVLLVGPEGGRAVRHADPTHAAIHSARDSDCK
ncbi:hypothetical protein E2C01_059544 [Portunus trituberculatus]|uniref:Uncharacterized protein n=1 Tax=Portunus trituberculatus TaxID=210409 RepID=A0A5B7GZG8_PORTR|nr:hypothetical protein [Portunus trituberculatus]